MRIPAAAAIVCVMACSQEGHPEKGKTPIRTYPLAVYRDTTVLDMHDGSRLSWRLKTRYMVKWPNTDLVRAAPVDLVVYDSLGAPLVWVIADSGVVDEAVNFLMAKGHVHGRSRQGMDLRTDSLRWNKSLNQVSTEARVHVIAENGDELTGKGFVSDANLNNWQILSDVHGVFQKAAARARALDSSSIRKARDTSAHPASADSEP